MPSDDRERSFENALARHLRPEGSHRACADAETLAAYHERSLAPEAMASLKAHVSECARCQEILGQMQATDEIPMATVDIVRPAEATAESVVRIVPARKATLWRWVAPAGALAAGLLVWIAVRENKPVPFVKPASTRDAATEVAKVQPASPPALPPTLEATGKGEAPSLRADSTSHAEPRTQSRLQSSVGANQEIGGATSAATQLLRPLSKDKELRSAPKKSSSAGGVGGGSAGAAPGFVTPSVPERVLEPTPPRGVTESVVVEAAPSSEVKNEVIAAELAKTEPDAKSANDKRDAAASRSVSPMSANASAAPPPAPEPSVAPAPVPQQSQTVEVMAESSAVTTLPMHARNSTDLTNLNQTALLLTSGSAAVTVTAPDGRASWRIGAAGVILFSSDAGKNWLVQPSGIITDLLAGSAPSSKVCWLVGRSGTILRTTDKGKHWKKVKPPTQDDLRSVFAVNARRATVSPAAGTYQTTDGGATWNKLPPE